MKRPGKRYLGDSVYVDTENGMLKLTTEDGRYVDQVIFLEIEVLAELLRYIEDLKTYTKAQAG